MSEALLNAGRQTLMLELQEASRLPERLGDDFVRAANIILHCEGKVVVSGIGKSGHIGKKIAATLASTGTPAFFVHPAEALHGDLGMIESRDVMLFISYSGGAKELDLIIPRLEDKSIALLAMTGKPTSPLGLAAKAVLDISVEREACPMHLAPTSSTVNTLMMETTFRVKLLYRTDQPQVALFDKVQQRQTTIAITAGNFYHQTQVTLDHPAARGDISTQCATRKINFFFGR